MAHVCAKRTIHADPTSVALLLADPATVELWPSTQRAEQDPDAGLSRLPVRIGELSGEVKLLPPTRTPRAFVLRFDFDAAEVPADRECVHVEGRLELTPAQRSPEAEDGPLTEASLELRAPEQLLADAEVFLARVADAAERRSRAA